MFIIGDKVKIIGNFSGSCNKIGDIGIISFVDKYGANVKVENRMGGDGHAFDELELVSENKLQSDWIENPTWEQLLDAEGWEFELTKNIATLPVRTCGRISKSTYHEKSVSLCQNVTNVSLYTSNFYGYKYGWVITCSSINNTKLKIRPYQSTAEHPLTLDDCFVLPKKWCVFVTSENVLSLNEYLHQNSQNYKNYTNSWQITNSLNNSYFHSEGENAHSTNEIRTGFTEITFKEFQQYVLKQPIKKEIFNDWCIKGCPELVDYFILSKNCLTGNSKCSFYYPQNYLDLTKSWNCDGNFPQNKKVISFQEFESTILNNKLNFQPLNNSINVEQNNIISTITNNNRSAEISYISGTDYTIERITGNRRIRLDYSGEQIYVGNFNSNNAKRPCIKY